MSIIDGFIKPTLQFDNKFNFLKKLLKKISTLKYKYDKNLHILKECKICWNTIQSDSNLVSKDIKDLQDKKINNDVDYKSPKYNYDKWINTYFNIQDLIYKGLVFKTCNKKHEKIQKKLNKWYFLIIEYEKMYDKFNQLKN